MDTQPFNAPADGFSTDTPVHRPSKKKDKTQAARAKAYRRRKKQKLQAASVTVAKLPSERLEPCNSTSTDSATYGTFELPRSRLRIAPSRPLLAAVLLTTAALALSAVGIAINGCFAQSLGSSDLSGSLFLAVGLAGDLAALVLPYTAAKLWHAGRRATALVAWAVWLGAFTFAVTAGIGFVSSNIADVTLARASRVTPAVTSAQAMLTDAVVARDRECKGGIGRFCREREAVVAERRQLLDAALLSVGQAADPQTDAAIKLIAWISGGMLQPARQDFYLFRLLLLAVLPQIGGLLLLIARQNRDIDAELLKSKS